MNGNVKRKPLYLLAIVLVVWGSIAWSVYSKQRLPAEPVFAADGARAVPARNDALRMAAEKEALAAAMQAHDREAKAREYRHDASSGSRVSFSSAASIPASADGSTLSPNASPSPAPSVSPGPAGKPSASAAAATVQASVYQPGAKPVVIPVLNYHSVAIDPGNIVVISPEKFAEQMDYLAQNGYTPLSLSDFKLMLERKKELPDKPVLLTFDDGYVDNVETVMPILKQHHFPATLFMSPGMTDAEGYINWEQAKTLRDAGWDIQPHGMTHPSLPKLKPEEQAYQIAEAKKQIEAQLGTTVDVFCYPYGQYNEHTLRILADEGFRYAFTIDQGKTTSAQHPYKLKRIFVNGEEGLSSFVYKLTKW